MVLRTTTRRRRNLLRLYDSRQEFVLHGQGNPVILDIGPGGYVDFLDKYLSFERKGNNRVTKNLLKILESGLRKTNLFELRSFEPFEIAALFFDLSPQKICVIDCEEKVLEAVEKTVYETNLSIPFEYVHVDIVKEIIPYRGDMVFSYNAVCRTKNPEIALGTVEESVNIGGLLSCNSRPSSKFLQVRRDLYQRVK